MSYTSNGWLMYIYGLKCPLTYKIFYVGQTDRLIKRYKEHCSTTSMGGNALRYLIVCELASINKRPSIVLLDRIVSWSMKDTNRLEIAWMDKLEAAGEPITNVVWRRKRVDREKKVQQFYKDIQQICKKQLTNV